MSLIELLISIVFIGVILVFIFQLLVELKGEKDTNNFAYNNQINRIQAIKSVQDDLKKYKLIGIENTTSSGSRDSTTIVFHFDPKSANKKGTLTITKSGDEYYFDYINYEGNKNRWKMIDATVDLCARFTFYKDSLSDNYFFKLNFFVYNKAYHDRNCKENNNYVDDIEITYAGNKRYLENNSRYLTYSAITDKKIGSTYNCT